MNEEILSIWKKSEIPPVLSPTQANIKVIYVQDGVKLPMRSTDAFLEVKCLKIACRVSDCHW